MDISSEVKRSYAGHGNGHMDIGSEVKRCVRGTTTSDLQTLIVTVWWNTLSLDKPVCVSMHACIHKPNEN